MGGVTKLNTFFKSSAILMVSNICLGAINFFLLPLYTRYLTPEMLGVSDTVTSMTKLLYPILVLGLDSAFSAFYFEEHSDAHAENVFHTIFGTLFCTGLIPIGLSLVSRPFSKVLFGSESYYMVLVLALISVSVNLWFLPFTLDLRMKNRMGTYGFITVTASLVMVLLNIYFVSGLKIGVYALVAGTVIAYTVKLLLLMVCHKRKVSVRKVDRSLLKRMLHFSLPIMPNTVVSWVLNLSDRYVLLFFKGEGIVGLYGIGGRFIGVLNLFVSAITTAYSSFAFSNADRKDAKKQYADILNLLYTVLICAAFVISIFSKEIVGLMTSAEYLEAYRPIRDMMFAQVLYGICSIINYGILFAKKSYYLLCATSAGAIVNLILNIVFIPEYGMTAAAATTLFGYVVMAFITYYFSEKLYPCDYGMKRIVVNMVILYIVCIIGADWPMISRIFLSAVCIGGTLIMFRKYLKEIYLMLRSEK